MDLKTDMFGLQEQYVTYSSFLEGIKKSYQIEGLCYKVFVNNCDIELSEPMLSSLSSSWPWWQDIPFFLFGSAHFVEFVCFHSKMLWDFHR